MARESAMGLRFAPNSLVKPRPDPISEVPTPPTGRAPKRDVFYNRNGDCPRKKTQQQFLPTSCIAILLSVYPVLSVVPRTRETGMSGIR
eukprot:2691484-Rhodomonas_salina.1